MLFTTPSQFAVLLLMLIVGWLFGFASHSGGRKWKQALRDEQMARAELQTRNAELIAERDSARAAAAAPPVAAGKARPAARQTQTAAKRGWFDWGSGDDLTRLRGVDGALAKLLYGEGVTTFAELAQLSDADEIALERRIDLPAGYIQREQLREQARLLADRDDDAHAQRFG